MPALRISTRKVFKASIPRSKSKLDSPFAGTSDSSDAESGGLRDIQDQCRSLSFKHAA